MKLIRAIAANDGATVAQLVQQSPGLAHAQLEHGATRLNAAEYYLDEVEHYVYAGDTALHVAAAAYRAEMAGELIRRGAAVGAANRRGAQPLHYAADGGPGSRTWAPTAQRETVVCLMDAGADPNAVDKGGVTPLQRAVRARCASAVSALLEGGSDPQQANSRGTVAMELALKATGRGGTGSPMAKSQQAEIIRLLEEYGTRR